MVTVVFADVVGSTALGERVDPETLRWAMQRWFERMRVAVERHGGTIENYIGDGIMAVFGIPAAHEDDALRAVRAAGEMRSEVAGLREELRHERGVDLAVRIGVNTGEAVTGSRGAGRLVHGRRHRQRGRAARAGGSCRRRPARRGDVAAGPPRDRRRGGRAADRERQERARSRPFASWPLPPTPSAARCGRARRWSGACASAGGCSTPSTRRSRTARVSSAPSSASPGVGKSRLVAEVTETLGDAATVAAGPLPAVRRRPDLVAAASRRCAAAWSTRPAARRPRPRRRSPSCSTRPVPRSCPTRRAGPCGGCSRRSPARGRSCSSSTTCSGPSHRSSSSSSTWRSGRATRRSSC